MESIRSSTRLSVSRAWLPSVPALVVSVLAAMLGASRATARIDWVKESGIVQLDSATAVTQPGITSLNWRTASPLAVPDRFGPGAVLTVGNVQMKVVNVGALGNPFPNTSSDPSAQWPGQSGVEYLSAILLAVGAVNPTATDPNAIRRVSYFQEWRPPSLDPVDRIYRAFDGIINGKRFENDDGDFDKNDPSHPPLIDEDFLDGHDNDGDGLIDEDHAALGQQEFSYVIRDDTPEAINTTFNEKHVPLGLQANVRAWAYSIQGYTDFNICEYDIINVSGHTLDSLTIGWLVDMDSGPILLSPFWTDDVDFPQYPQGEFVYRVGGLPGDLPDPARLQVPHDPSLNARFPADSALCPRVTLRVNGFSVTDQDGDMGRTPGIGTFMLIDHTVDPTGVNGPRRVQFHSFRSTTNGVAYEQGGIPRLDQERFAAMVSGENVDPVTGFITQPPGGNRGDYVEWCSIGPWRNVKAGQTITATIAFGVSGKGTFSGFPSALAGQYGNDLARYQAGSLTASDLVSKYPALANALTAQVAFEGINEPRDGYPETRSASDGGRDFHGRETGIKLPRGTPPTTIIEDCSAAGRERREVIVTDRDYSWFDFDCDYCTGVWDYPTKRGLFHKTWNASAPPPNPNTNVSSNYNFSDNPNRLVVPSGDRSIRVAWDNISECTADPKTRWFDFRGFDIWKVADWTRPVGSAGPNDSDWRLLGEFRVFNYYTGNNPGDPPYECNYARDARGNKVCPMVFIPNLFDTQTGQYGKTVPMCLDRFDLWNQQSGEVIKPDWTTPCVTDTAGVSIPLEINSGDLEWGGSVTGGVFDHVFPKAGTYNYLCLRHPQQKASVIVANGGADSATVQIVDATPAGFSPPAVTIRPGGHVRWINASAQNHALQSDRNCQTVTGVIVHRPDLTNPGNLDTYVRYPVGRYQFVDHEVKNGFVYFYSVTAFDSTTDKSITTQLGGRRAAVEAEGVTPQASVDANGRRGAWVVPNPYRGYAILQQRPSAWDLTPNASDPTGTHIDFMGLPRGNWTIRIYTVAGDLVKQIRSSDSVNESIRQPVLVSGTSYPGYNRQQDNPDDGEASWNLISRNGQDIVSGIYLFTVESSEGTQRGKFVVIR